MQLDKNQRAENDIYYMMKELMANKDINGYFPREELTTLTDILCMYVVDKHIDEDDYEE